MNAYQALKDRQQKEVNAFPMFFAFSQKQFDEGMKKFGLEPDDTEAIYSLSGTGGFYKRADAPRFHEMADRHQAKLQAAIDGDTSGNGFIFEMFSCELANHEYIITGDVTDALEALCLTVDEVNGNKNLLRGLKRAVKAQRERM